MDFIWNVTGHCNLKCPGCWDPFKAEKTTSYEQLLTTLQSLDLRECKVVTFTGGEPLLQRDLCKVIRKVRDAGVPEVKLCTNGTLLRRRARELAESGITEVHVSLDSIDEDAHASIGNLDQHAAAKNILQELNAFRDEMQAAEAKVAIVLVSVVDPRQIVRFERVLEYATSAGYQVSYQLLCPFSSWLPDITENLGDVGPLFQRLESLHQKYRRTLNFFNLLYLLAAKRYVENGDHEPCGAGQAFQVIDPSGNRHACYRPNSDPINMGCFDERCLIWCRSHGRGERIARMISASNEARP
jgi:molybdenum cofactor biosynthesis enzyme MoaA